MGDKDRAVADYSKAVEINPQHSHAYLNRGKAFEAKGDSTRQRLCQYRRTDWFYAALTEELDPPKQLLRDFAPPAAAAQIDGDAKRYSSIVTRKYLLPLIV
jgi:TPR repeat